MTQSDRPYAPVPPPAGGQPVAYGPSGYGPADNGAGFPPGYPVPAWAKVRPDPMPATPVEYQHLVRGGRYAWWRPLLTLLLCAGFDLVVQVIAGIAVGAVSVATGTDVSQVLQRLSDTSSMGPLTFSVVIIGLVGLIPSAMFASWIVNGVRPRYLASVAGGFRWRWLVRCLIITVPVFLIYLGLQFVTGWSSGPRPAHWGILLIMVIIGIPFQSAGEEYAFRGLILQNVGAWFRNPTVGLVVAMIPSMILFALAHGSHDPWVFSDLAIFALSSCVAAWRTGGLEASIALHATNNVLLMIATLLFGGWNAAFVSSNTVGSPIEPLSTLVVNGVCVALILWQAKRVGLQRRYQPQQRQLPPASGQPLAGPGYAGA